MNKFTYSLIFGDPFPVSCLNNNNTILIILLKNVFPDFTWKNSDTRIIIENGWLIHKEGHADPPPSQKWPHQKVIVYGAQCSESNENVN